MWRQPRRVVKDNRPPRGTVRLGTQVWPATAIGASEFRRTQAGGRPGLPSRGGLASVVQTRRAWHGGPNLRHHRCPQNRGTPPGRRSGKFTTPCNTGTWNLAPVPSSPCRPPLSQDRPWWFGPSRGMGPRVDSPFLLPILDPTSRFRCPHAPPGPRVDRQRTRPNTPSPPRRRTCVCVTVDQIAALWTR